MAKEKKTLFEEMEFEDVNVAQEMVEECEQKLARNKIGVIFALLVPVFDVLIALILGGLGFGDDSAFTFWIIFAVIAYLIGGGLLSALKMVWRVTWFTFYLIPIFPIDLLFGAAAFCLSGAVALFLPIVFVLLSKHQYTMDLDAAKSFLGGFTPAGANSTSDEEKVVYEPSSVKK